MKRWVSALLAVAMVFGLAGCGGSAGEAETTIETAEPVTEAAVETTVETTEATTGSTVAEETDSIWTPELIAVMLESSFMQNFSYAKAHIDDDTVTLAISNNGFGSAVSPGKVSEETWSTLQDQVVTLYNNTLDAMQDEFGGRAFVLNLVDDSTPEKILLSASHGEIIYDILNSDTEN